MNKDCMMDVPEGFNQLELLETHGHMIPVGTESAWEDEDGGDEDDEGHRSEEWYQQQEMKLKDKPSELLLWAAEKNRLATVERLLAGDPSLLRCRDEDGYTPLHRAAYSGHLGVVLALLAAGADVNARTADEWTPLHSSCRWGHTAVASCLLRHGAEVNAMTSGRLTPLQLAAGNPLAGQTIELLLSQRLLDAGLKNSAGETAYEIAHRTSPYYSLFEVTEPCNNVY